MKAILSIYLFAYFVFIFAGSKIAKRGEFFDDAFDKKRTCMLQAFACIGVIIHHLTQYYSSYGTSYIGPITVFSSIGILFTSLFFFCSGYGLISSVLKREDYLNGFLSHRLKLVLIPFFVANFIMLLYRMYVLSVPSGLKESLCYVLGLRLLNGNGWYIVEIFWIYIFFFIVFKIINNKNVAILTLSIITILLIAYSYGKGHDLYSSGQNWFMGEWWYNSTVVFILGMYVARYKDKLLDFIKKHYCLILSVVSFLLIVSFFAEERIINVYGYYKVSYFGEIDGKLLTLFSQMILNIIFVLFVLIVSLKIKIGNNALEFILSISLELFLLHGMVLDIVENIRCNIPLSYLLTLSISIPLSWLISKFDKALIKLISYLPNAALKRYTNEKDLIYEEKVKKQRIAKKIVITVLGLGVLISALYRVIDICIIEPIGFKNEMKAINNAQIFQEVKFGKFDTKIKLPGKERLEWLVLDKSDYGIMLITKEGIDGGAYHNKHERISWKDSSLHEKINGDMYDSMFSSSEKSVIIPNPENGDMMSLLSEKEAENYFGDDINRQISVTDYAVKKGVYVNQFSKVNAWDYKGYRSCWWWLRGCGEADIYAPIVTVDGVISKQERYVNKPGGAIRLVVFVKGD